MHEFGIGEELVKAVLEEMGRLTPPQILHSVRVVVGAMRQVLPENLRLAYEIQTRDTPAAGSSLEITVVPATALCGDCGWQGGLNDLPYLCHECGTTNLQILQGMELYLAGLQVKDHDTIE